MNELIFVFHGLIISISSLIALKMGKEALVAFISVSGILANLFVIKQTTLCGFTATCSDAFTIGAVLGLNLLQEYYGRDVAKKAIWISFFLLLFYAIASHIHLLYIPTATDTTHALFCTLLDCMPRIAIASFSVYLLVQHIDSWLYAQLKLSTHGKYLILRNCISIGICQLLDTILFSFLGLYGLVDDIWSIIIVSYLIKIGALLLAIPGIALSKKLV
jgi:uncharacterized integral membrane protein (TIGR00697 family)